MALTKDKKASVVEETAQLIKDSKLTVAAFYPGTSVKQIQGLRSQAKAGGTTIRIVKNRLFKKALEEAGHKDAVDQMPLTGQLMYIFNDQDEVAAAQVAADFAKINPEAKMVSGLNADGEVVSAEDLMALASLPSKDQLRAQLAATISAPVSNFVGVMSAVNRSVMNVLNAHAETLS